MPEFDHSTFACFAKALMDTMAVVVAEWRCWCTCRHGVCTADYSLPSYFLQSIFHWDAVFKHRPPLTPSTRTTRVRLNEDACV